MRVDELLADEFGINCFLRFVCRILISEPARLRSCSAKVHDSHAPFRRDVDAWIKTISKRLDRNFVSVYRAWFVVEVRQYSRTNDEIIGTAVQ